MGWSCVCGMWNPGFHRTEAIIDAAQRRLTDQAIAQRLGEHHKYSRVPGIQKHGVIRARNHRERRLARISGHSRVIQ